jgi:hypothetical protein
MWISASHLVQIQYGAVYCTHASYFLVRRCNQGVRAKNAQALEHPQLFCGLRPRSHPAISANTCYLSILTKTFESAVDTQSSEG